MASSVDLTEHKLAFESKLIEYEQQHQGAQRKPWTNERIQSVISKLKTARATTSLAHYQRTAMDYYWMSRYDIVTSGNEEYLIFKKKSPGDPTIHVIPREEYFDYLRKIHLETMHAGRDRMVLSIKNKIYIPKKAIELFISECPECYNKKTMPKSKTINRNIKPENNDIRGQFDLIDFQVRPDGDYKWLLSYQDCATYFLNLRPLNSKSPCNVATELVKIFLMFGAPYVLQSGINKEFTESVIEGLMTIWPECKIVNGNSMQPVDSSFEQNRQDLKNMLNSWMADNKSSKWSLGCFFCQYEKNTTYHPKIRKSPYKALFGTAIKIGQDVSIVPATTMKNVELGEQSENQSEKKYEENVLLEEDINQALTQLNDPSIIDNEPSPMSTDAVNLESKDSSSSHNESLPFSIDNIKTETNDMIISNNDPLPLSIVKIKTETVESNISNNDPLPLSFVNIKTESIESSISSDDSLPRFVGDVKVEPQDSNIGNIKTGNEEYEVAIELNPCGNTTGSNNKYEPAIKKRKVDNLRSLNSKCSDSDQKQNFFLSRVADQTTKSGSKCLTPLAIGDTVCICSSKCDSSISVSETVRGKIVDIQNGAYRVGTKIGTIKNWFTKDILRISPDVYTDEIGEDLISLRQAVIFESQLRGQHLIRCRCKPAINQCQTNRCVCHRNDVACGSECHAGSVCLKI